LWIQSFKYKQMHKLTEILIRTKRIGRYKLNKIVSLVFERCANGWWVYIEGRSDGVSGYGDTKKQAKNEFVKDFENNFHIVSDLIECINQQKS